VLAGVANIFLIGCHELKLYHFNAQTIGVNILISISIRRGKAQKPQEKNVHMVNVRLIGPTSMSENIITRMEAKELGKALRQYLR